MSNVKIVIKKILAELNEVADTLDEAQITSFEKEIQGAKRIFCAGAGRSRLMISGLAMRLMQMGYQSYLVGEVVTPAIEEGDLLIIASGSGRTASLVTMAEKARKTGARLALITINEDSPIGELANCSVCIDAATTKEVSGQGRKSFQPGANPFEQSVLLFCDALIIDMISSSGSVEQNNKILMSRHANLE